MASAQTVSVILALRAQSLFSLLVCVIFNLTVNRFGGTPVASMGTSGNRAVSVEVFLHFASAVKEIFDLRTSMLLLFSVGCTSGPESGN